MSAGAPYFYSSQSTSSLSSTSSRSPFVNRGPQKDFEAAFSRLQSTYGTNGHIPTPVSKPQGKPETRAHKPQTMTSAPSYPSTYQPKNYEAAFGKLSSSYGSHGQSPMVPQQPNTQDSFTKRLFGKA